MKIFRGLNFVAGVALAFALFATSMHLKVASAAQETKPADMPSGNAENGKRLFNKIGCYECHGREGQGSPMSGPRIAPAPIPFDVLTRYVRKPTGEMPPFTAKVVSDQELADIYAFLQSRPHPPDAKNIPGLK
jgi:mono/diheme cytochrome c family protein